MGKPNAYDDIPGTTVFDAQRSRQGYHLNMFCMSLMKAENRTEFKADEGAYLDRFPMTGEQKQAVLARDWNRMISLGGNIYYLADAGYERDQMFPVTIANHQQRSRPEILYVADAANLFAAAHLVERSTVQAYREKVSEAVKRRPELHFLVSGPWPPYSFANIELEFLTQFGVT